MAQWETLATTARALGKQLQAGASHQAAPPPLGRRQASGTLGPGEHGRSTACDPRLHPNDRWRDGSDQSDGCGRPC